MQKQHSLARDAGVVVATILGTVLLATGLDPYLSLFGAPLLATAINAAIPVLVALATLAATGRWLLAIPAGLLVFGLLVVADHFKMQALYNNLLFADLTLVPELLKQPELVLGFARLDAKGWALLALALAVAGAAVFFALRSRPIGRWMRAGVAVAVVGACVLLSQTRVSHAVPKIGWLLPMQIAGAQKAGVAGNVLLGALSKSHVRPQASADAIAAFWADPRVQAAKAALSAPAAGPRPDIVVVQSESLFEPSLLCGVGDAPVLQTMAALPGDGFQNLQVPVFGHRTLQTEFEVLTGFPVRFAPNSMFSYYDLVDGPMDALPRQLGALGYRTIALHPSRRSFWRRDVAFPAMGFDTFIDGSAYFSASDFSRFGWVNDQAMTRTILAQLDGSAVPTMVFAVSIENHGPWGTKGAPDAKGVQVPDTLQGPARAELLDYIDRARTADENLGVLLKALSKRTRPTLVVFYGDHLPALGTVYAQTCFKDGKKPEAHSPPLRAWSNFPLATTFDGPLHSHLLPARLLRAAGLPLQGAFLAGAIADQIQRDPAIDARDKQRILGQYAHVAARAVLDAPVEAEKPTAFIASRQANDVFLGMQSSGPRLARRMDGDVAKGATWPARAGEVGFALDKRVAAAVLRPWAGGEAACVTKPLTLQVVADGQVVARSRFDHRAVAVQALPLSGVETLVLRVEGEPGVMQCAEVGLEVSQVLCYAPSCDAPGQRAMYAKRGPLGDRDEFDAMHDALAAAVAATSDSGRADDMLARATGHQAAQPVRITPDNKIFLHPAVDKPSWMEFDVQGLTAVTLAPSIQPLNAPCLGNPTAGVVRMDVSLDGREVARVDVDRHYKGQVPVALDGARRLRVTFDAGNGVTWCDWASVGFPAVQAAAALGGL